MKEKIEGELEGRGKWRKEIDGGKNEVKLRA